jgi:hypothetical protein
MGENIMCTFSHVSRTDVAMLWSVALFLFIRCHFFICVNSIKVSITYIYIYICTWVCTPPSSFPFFFSGCPSFVFTSFVLTGLKGLTCACSDERNSAFSKLFNMLPHWIDVECQAREKGSGARPCCRWSRRCSAELVVIVVMVLVDIEGSNKQCVALLFLWSGSGGEGGVIHSLEIIFAFVWVFARWISSSLLLRHWLRCVRVCVCLLFFVFCCPTPSLSCVQLTLPRGVGWGRGACCGVLNQWETNSVAGEG